MREQFGSVLVEGMACGLPAIAVDRFGPADIVDDGGTGWLVEPDDEAALAGALADALDDPDERRRRGRRAGATRTTASPGRRWRATWRRCSTRSPTSPTARLAASRGTAASTEP